MDLVTVISLLNASMLSIAMLGCLLFISIPAYRGVCILLGLVSLAALTNVFEDLRISRDLHLISPVFMFAYGPALYFAVKRLTTGALGYHTTWHFLPMILSSAFYCSYPSPHRCGHSLAHSLWALNAKTDY